MNQSETPTVSVIMPVYNAQETIDRAIFSVLAQSFSDWELLAIDDRSNDESDQKIKKWSAQDRRIHSLEMPHNSGAGATRNHGISQARGRYIAFLDSDDEWLPEKLEKQIGWMREHQYDFSCTAYEAINKAGNLRIRHVPPSVDRAGLLRNNTVGTLTAVYDAEKLGKVLMPEIRRRQDFALWLRLLERTENVYGLDEVLARYHATEHSLSSNKFIAAKDQWRFYRNSLKMGFAKSTYYFFRYAISASRRHF